MENFHSEMIPEQGEQQQGGSGSWRRSLLDIIETIILSIVLFVGVNTVSSRIRVESISMQPTLNPGNFVLVNKIAYKWSQPQRGDIIVFLYPPDPTQVPYIKRVIGLPGDQVHIAGGKVYVNGNPLAEPYLVVTTNHGGDWTVPANSLFVMGDNRNNSSDSRTWGMVPEQNIIGRAVLVYWPPEKWGMLNIPTAVAAQP